MTDQAKGLSTNAVGSALFYVALALALLSAAAVSFGGFTWP